MNTVIQSPLDCLISAPPKRKARDAVPISTTKKKRA